MLIVISPAKKLDMTQSLPFEHGQQPHFLDQAESLVEQLRRMESESLAGLMRISMQLAELNRQRMREWQRPFDASNATYALAAFQGDVYRGMDAASFDASALRAAERRLRILSGLYGVLRPNDWMQAYRLEMGTRLANPAGRDLYAFWGERIGRFLREEMRKISASVLLNLASQEYFRATCARSLGIPTITPVFREWRNGRYQIIGIHAKRARGLMARHILTHDIENPEALKSFHEADYRYREEDSSEDTWVFARGP